MILDPAGAIVHRISWWGGPANWHERTQCTSGQGSHKGCPYDGDADRDKPDFRRSNAQTNPMEKNRGAAATYTFFRLPLPRMVFSRTSMLFWMYGLVGSRSSASLSFTRAREKSPRSM